MTDTQVVEGLEQNSLTLPENLADPNPIITRSRFEQLVVLAQDDGSEAVIGMDVSETDASGGSRTNGGWPDLGAFEGPGDAVDCATTDGPFCAAGCPSIDEYLVWGKPCVSRAAAARGGTGSGGGSADLDRRWQGPYPLLQARSPHQCGISRPAGQVLSRNWCR